MKRKVEVGQVWWDGNQEGFAEVRGVDGEVATVGAPADFWNDCRTIAGVRRVATSVMLAGNSEWEGPYSDPKECPHAERSATYGWCRKGVTL